uniref:Uncharacterized protein n=1 Tax=Biomphalaria glabrata TaxID=6526 RepID=A0A2C9LSM7_BIOGL
MQVERYQPGPNLTDVGPVAKTGEESPDGGKENPRQSDVDIDGHLKDESHRPGLKPTSDWPDTETRESGHDDGGESRLEPEAKDEVECYQPAPRTCPPDKAEDDDLSHNSLPCGFEAHPSPSPQSPMKSPFWPTILVSPALTSYTSPCVKWLPSVPNGKRAMQPQHHCNKRTTNWRKRRRRRLRSPTCMVILPRNNCSHMKTNWRRRKRLLNSTWMAIKARRRGNQVKANWRRTMKLTATWMAPSSSRGKPTATDRPPLTAMKLHSQCHDVDSVRDGQI